MASSWSGTADTPAAHATTPPAWSAERITALIHEALGLSDYQRQLVDMITMSVDPRSTLVRRRPGQSLVGFIVVVEDLLNTALRTRREITETLDWLQDCLRAVRPCRPSRYTGALQPRATNERFNAAALIWRDLYTLFPDTTVTPPSADSALTAIYGRYLDRSASEDRTTDEIKAELAGSGLPDATKGALARLADAFELGESAEAIYRVFGEFIRGMPGRA